MQEQRDLCGMRQHDGQHVHQYLYVCFIMAHRLDVKGLPYLFPTDHTISKPNTIYTWSKDEGCAQHNAEKCKMFIVIDAGLHRNGLAQ